jgi:hypothetical protein
MPLENNGDGKEKYYAEKLRAPHARSSRSKAKFKSVGRELLSFQAF